MEKGMKRVHVFINGKVHGVFFRANIMDLAVNLELNGFVKNLDDGRVEAVFEGEEEAIDEMVKFCKKGPVGAKVEGVELKEEQFKGEFSEFEIAY